MATEWEKLEKLSKDELILELVKARWERMNLQKVLLDLADNMGSFNLFADGEIPPKEWQAKIAKYVFKDDEYHNLQEWGVEEETSDRLRDIHYDEDGRLKILHNG